MATKSNIISPDIIWKNYCFVSSTKKTVYFFLAILLVFPVLISSVPVNVALNRPVTALYTCGKFGREPYNTIYDTQKSYADRQGSICKDLRPNGNPNVVKTPSHGAVKMVDGKEETWWQSTSRNRRYHYGTEMKAEENQLLEALITVDLQQEFLAEKIIIRLGDALTPQKIAIRKSLDGVTYTPWIYAVSKVTFCITFFKTTFNSVPSDAGGTVCLPYEADNVPPADIITLDVSSIPAVLKDEWTRIRYLEIKFYSMLFAYPFNHMAHTFNHYAIRELSVMAECPCNGQQQDCQPSPTTGQYECVCGGNTKGRYCESCMPMFNQYKFQHGVPCQECNCFNHATSCFYQPIVEQNQESLDKDGNKKGGGVCLDCQDNTAGTNCNECVRMYYRPVGVAQTDMNACVACGCSTAGSTINPDSGVADCVMSNDKARTDGKVPGNCFCKDNVQGVKCDTCKAGFYKLDEGHDEGCIECACFTPGTVGSSTICVGDATGQCQCKANVQGRACNECKDGFYALSADNAEGCVPCACDVGGSVDQKCDKVSGQCTCRSNNIKGRTCNSVESRFFYPSDQAIHDQFEDSFGLLNWKSDKQYQGFSGKGYAEPDKSDSLNVLLSIPSSSQLSGDFILVLVYQSPAGETTNAAVNIVSKSAEDKTPVPVSLPVCTGKWCLANTGQAKLFKLSSGPNLFTVTLTDGKVLLDKLVAVPIEYTKTSTVLSTPLPAGCDFLQNTLPQSAADIALCKQALFSITMYYWGNALPCDCDATGSVNPVCEVHGGQCLCHTGVLGRRCDACSADHFGFTSSGCKPCECDSLGSSCDPGTGQCQCPENTFGRQCEHCLPGSWGWQKSVGCKDCNCHAEGAAFPQCDGASGICTCKPGVQGEKCDECKDNFYNLGSLGCSPCDCDMGGSVDAVCNKTSGQCKCKSNTQGRQCNQCMAGTFGLDTGNPNGCLNCICMGVTTKCSSSDMKFSSEPFGLSSTSGDSSTPNIMLATVDGKTVSTKIEIATVDNGLTKTLQFSYEAAQPVVYWKMPSVFISNLINLYGSTISATLNYVNVDGQALSGLKAVILTSDAKKINADVGQVNTGFDKVVSISLRESAWKLEGSAVALDRKEFLKILARGSDMLIPATFSSGKHTSRLSRLEFSVQNSAGVINPSAEKCECGSSYSGNSCEKCASGYKRSDASLAEYFGVCVTCECNGHSTTCNEETSECLNCQHNTEGKLCEKCALGFYGDATKGTAGDCLPCPCFQPRVVNAKCHAEDENGVSTVKCDFCREGYIGDLCQQCDVAYYGNPQANGGTCTKCECNGNSDTCDSVTGICQNCKSNTVGDKCERCALNFYGDASAQNCQECACLQPTSTSLTCASDTGQCPCVAGVGGRTCDKCLQDYWGFSNEAFVGCKVCGCNAAGSVTTQCAGDTGKCTCKQNTEGDLCDKCSPNFFGLPDAACQACDCNTDGTVPATTCDVTTGKCSCQPGVGGRKCDQCLPLYVSFSSAGCQKCGQCQDALGTSVTVLTTNVQAFVNTAQTVYAVQDEDTRLQTLSTQLDASLKRVGLSGSDATDVSDILNNITTSQNTLQNSFATIDNQAKSLSATSGDLNTKSTAEASEQKTMLDNVKSILGQLTPFERDLTLNLQTLTQYSNSAKKLTEKGKGAGTINVDLSSNLATANALLAKVQNVADFNTVIETIKSQETLTTAQITALDNLKKQFDVAAISVDDLTSELNSVAFNVGVTDNSLDEALIFKSQAEELSTAVQTILKNTENGNIALSSTLSTARVAVSNANTINSGDARSLFQGEDAVDFLEGVTNYDNGKSRLDVLLSSIKLLVDQISTSVIGSETHLSSLQKNFETLNLTFKDLPTIGKEANTAIKNYELVIEDLDNSVKMANTASNLITKVQSDLSGDALATRKAAYDGEKQTSETKRDELVKLDYKPQVLESSLTAQKAQLDKEPENWKQADAKVEGMNTAAQVLSAKLEDNPLNEQLTAAETKVKEAATKSENVAESVDGQSKVLDQKEKELETTKSQIQQVNQLNTQVRTNLNNHLSAFSDLDSKLKDAASARDSGLASTTKINEKIKLLETKLATAESMLEKLRQPRTFDGSLSLQINNPKANTATTVNSLSLNVRKAADFSDGNIFFTENQSNDEEFEVGIKSNKVFFEFSANGGKVTVMNPAEICNDCWAKVVASRMGNIGYLSVTKLPSGDVISSSNSGDPSSLATPMTLTSSLYVGSLPQDTNIKKVANKQFKGCLWNINFESQAINLWSAAVSSNQEAKCCTAPPTSGTTLLPDTTSFTGFGVVVKDYKNPVLNDLDTFSFEFRTFSQSGTIVLVSSENSQSLLSIGLSSGAVVLRTKANGNDVSIKTDKAYNTGKWAKVVMQKTPTQRQLLVNFLDDAGNTETKTGQLVDLSALGGRYLIVGASSNPFTPGTTVQQATSTFLSQADDSYFSGCLRKAEIKLPAASESEPIDLVEDVIIREGVIDGGCVQTVVPGLRFLSESSYVQMPSNIDLTQLASIELKFATTEDHGILLYAMTADKTRYLYVGIFGGHINVKYQQENPGVVVSRDMYVSDGQEHTLKIDMLTSRVSVNIDGVFFEESSQTLTSPFLTFVANSKLYLGGTPDNTLTSSNYPSIKSFVGGIMHFSLNKNPVDLKQSSLVFKEVSLSGIPTPLTVVVNIDNCVVKSSPTLLPPQLGISLSGSSSIPWNSHTEAGPKLQTFFANDFTLDIDFASYKSDGVFLYVANSITNPSLYYTIFMENGLIKLKMRSSSGTVRTAQITQKYNDGQRYTLKSTRQNDFATLQVGVNDYSNTGAAENPVTTLTIPDSVNIVLAGSGIFDIPQSPLPSSFDTDRTKLSFAGAIYTAKLTANQVVKTLLISSLDRTAFPAVPQSVTYGVTLDGVNSYLGLGPVVTSSQKTIEMKISTTTRSALLLAMYKDSKYFVIDYTGNQIRLHLSASGSFPSVTTPIAIPVFELPAPKVLCDGKAHTISINFQANKITFKVDDMTKESTIPVTHEVKPFASASFMIGGLPDVAGPSFEGVTVTRMEGCVESIKLTTESGENNFDPTQYASSSKGLKYGCPNSAS